MSQQGRRQASFRAIHGETGGTYNSDAYRAFQAEATIPAGSTFNEAFILWLQERLGSSSTNLPGLMAAFAVANGADKWSSLGSFDPGAYSPNFVSFDGENDYLTRNALEGAAAGGQITLACSINATISGESAALSAGASSVSRGVAIYMDQFTGAGFTPGIAFRAANSSATRVLEAAISHSSNTLAQLVMSVDLSSDELRHFLKDGSDASPTWNTYTEDGEINYEDNTWAVGGVDSVSGMQLLQGTLADLLLWDSYIDLSDPDNVALFYADGKPQDPALAIAELGTPLLGFSGATSTWHQNTLGSGGAFTLNGSLT